MATKGMQALMDGWLKITFATASFVVTQLISTWGMQGLVRHVRNWKTALKARGASLP